MKKYLFLFCIMVFAVTLKAQDMAVNVYGGYLFGDDVTLQYGYGHIDESPLLGGSLEFNLQRGVSVELSYQYQSTSAYTSGGLTSESGDLAISYIMIEGNRYSKIKEKVSMFFGGGLGMAIVTPGDNFETVGRLAWKIKAGALISASDKIGIKLGMQLNSCVQGIGGGLYFGTGGAGVGATAYSSMYQFGFNGGLYIRFGKDGSDN